ncbi:MAG: hypothetical protein ABI568_06610 [Pseudarthrobacter sp.]
MSINSPESLPDDEPQEDAAAEAVNRKDDGGVPTGTDGVGLGFTHEANTFEPEEDTEAE